MESSALNQSPIRSFVRRGGRATTAQQRGLRQWQKVYGLELSSTETADWRKIFGRLAPRLVEIGCGYGEATVAIAKQFPQNDFIVFEVWTPALGALLNRLAGDNIANVRAVCGDAKIYFPRVFADGSLAGVHLFFPDPWQKRRHHKRRIMNRDFVELLAKKLQAGGIFWMATDWQDYAKTTVDLLTKSGDWTALSATENEEYRRCRPPTKFQNRAEREGRAITDIIFRRLATSGYCGERDEMQ